MVNSNIKTLIVYSSEPTPPEKTKLYSSFKKISPYTYLLFTEGKLKLWYILFYKIFYKLKLPIDYTSANKRVRSWVETYRPDLVFVIKGNTIWPSTLLYLKKKGCKIVSWSNDDMYAWHGRSIFFTLGVKYYDLIVTQKSYNLNSNELPSLGAQKLLFQNKSFDKSLHYRCDNNISELSHDVIFIGTYEHARYRSLKFVANHGIKVNIYGWGRKMKNTHSNLIFHDTHLYDERFRCAITGSKICLNFLRKRNRDLQTSRSIEIPACGGFMLAERTQEHLNLFREGIEADYFSSDIELLEKILYYLKNEEVRIKIAQNGYNRCQNDDYSFDKKIEQIIGIVFSDQSLP